MSDTAPGRTFLHPDEALAMVEAWDGAPELEEVPLRSALGRALGRALPALVDQPPFDKAAMDGFACGPAAPGADPAGPWRVVATVPAGAGAAGARPLGPGECARIMTGAPMPPGALRVQRVEWSVEGRGAAGEELARFTAPEPDSNVIRRAENQAAGDSLMSPRILAPQDLALLASSGYGGVPVARRPVVAVLSTGDELAAPGDALRDGAIYDTNGPQLAAQAQAAGCDARFLGIVRDEPGALERATAGALEGCDVLVMSGGVSMGDFDYATRAFAAAGVERAYHGLAMKPGKPSYFGRRGSQAVFGLPGNPVSTFVGFELLVKAHLYRRMGLRYEPRAVAAALASPIVRRGADRVEFLPARLERAGTSGPQLVRPIRYHGSSMLSALAEADCLVRVDIGVERVDEGRVVLARLVRP